MGQGIEIILNFNRVNRGFCAVQLPFGIAVSVWGREYSRQVIRLYSNSPFAWEYNRFTFLLYSKFADFF